MYVPVVKGLKQKIYVEWTKAQEIFINVSILSLPYMYTYLKSCRNHTNLNWLWKQKQHLHRKIVEDIQNKPIASQCRFNKIQRDWYLHSIKNNIFNANIYIKQKQMCHETNAREAKY